ncbi:hypothetical protein ACJMK2_028083 [Sinanodonta woodiana]|uniref:Endonuclease/exonuclease/phosphatase domain-containing protein n=1 Tax=Sinanodonta woodiana TaxID=1069815 RepID=A0ABD3X870_SINWO
MPRITRASLSKSPAAERKKSTTPKGGKTQTPKKDAVPVAKKVATPAKSPARSTENRSASKGRQTTPVSSASATRTTSKRKSSVGTPAKSVQKESTPAKKGRIASPSPVTKSRPSSRGRSTTKVEPAKSNKKSTTPAKKSTTPAKKATSAKKSTTPAKSRSQSRQGDTPKGKVKTEAAKKVPAKSQPKSRERSLSKGKTVAVKQKAAPLKKTPQKSASKTTTPKSETKLSTSRRSTSRGQGNDAVQSSESMPGVSVVVEKMDSRRESKSSPKEEEKSDSEVKCTSAETTEDAAENIEEGNVTEGAQAKEVKEKIEEAKEESPVKEEVSEKGEGQQVAEVDEAEIEQEEKLDEAEVEEEEKIEVEKDKDDKAEVEEVQKDEELDVEEEKGDEEVEEVEEFEAKKVEDQQIAKDKATVPAVAEEPEKEAQIEKEISEKESPVIIEDEKSDAVVEELPEAVEVSDEVQEIDEDMEEIPQDICVQEIPTEVIDDEVTTVTDVEMVEEISAVEETAPIEANVPASAILEAHTNEQPNGEASEPGLVSPRRKRKWDELGEDAEESLSPKKLRVSTDVEEPVPKEVVSQQNGEQPSAEEEVIASEEAVGKDFEIVDMSNIPASDSQEVLDSLPKAHTLSTDQAAMDIKQSVSNDDQSQDFIDAQQSSQVETVDPVLNRVFVPSPNFQSENANPEKQFSLVSYNVLADCHLKRNDYSFTDPKYLQPEHRLNRLLDELHYLDGDVICLQEVSPEFFNDKLYPRLTSIGYDGFFQKRTNDFYHEGEATFYKTARFTHIASQKYGLKDLNVAEIPEGTDQDLRAAIEKYIDSADVLIVTRLKCCKTGQEVTIGNIHVIWGEMKVPDVQCIQICSAVKTVVNMAVGEANPHIICGDFNSEPSSSAYQLLKEGYIGDEAIQTLQNIDGIVLPDGSRQALVNKLWQAFQHTSSSLKSAYLIAQGEEPKISSYNKVMCACVDYIFYSSSSLDNVGVYKLANPEKIRETGGTPNQFFPSDHMSLKAVLSFK